MALDLRAPRVPPHAAAAASRSVRRVTALPTAKDSASAAGPACWSWTRGSPAWR